MDYDEKQTLTPEELFRLQFYQEKIQTFVLKEQVKRIEMAAAELTMKNHLLEIQALKNANGNRREEINTIRSKATILTEERNAFVTKICEAYNLDASKFGYDDVTGEILQYSDDISDKSDNEEATKE